MGMRFMLMTSNRLQKWVLICSSVRIVFLCERVGPFLSLILNIKEKKDFVFTSLYDLRFSS